MRAGNSEEGEEWSHQSVLQRSQTISIKEEEIEDADFKIVIGASPSAMPDVMENMKKEELQINRIQK